MRTLFKYISYLIVFIGFSLANAGSYEDFFKAIAMDDERTLKSLLQRGFDPNTLNPDHQHPLYLALREPSPKAVKLLLDQPRLQVDSRNLKDETPLMLAALKSQLEVAARLIELKADVNKPGWAPLHYAATSGNVSIIRLLLDNDAYLDAESPNGTTPLMMAAMYGSPAAVKVLLEAGADPTVKNNLGMSALDFANQVNRKDSASLISAFLLGWQEPAKQ